MAIVSDYCPDMFPTSGIYSESQNKGYLSIKSSLDVFLAFALFVLTLPLMIVAMVLVRLTSPGPALYRQTRVGHLGRIFTIYKIRTMVQDCERLTGAVWATEGDPRVTRVGRFLRYTHLDELPQLWNVLRGEMSLVGPRPERPEFVTLLERDIPRYRDRLLVRPGVTGLAQVQLRPDSDLESVRRKLACDLFYVRRINPWLDARILLSTISAVAGLPFVVPRVLLRIPAGPSIEEIYRELFNEPRPIPQVQTT